MKKLILILSMAVCLVAYQAFGQTISVTGVNSNIGAASGSFVDITLSLNVTGNNSIGNVESVNMLLRTFAQGLGLSGNGLFQLSMVTPISPFSATNAPPSTTSTFSTAGDAANSS